MSEPVLEVRELDVEYLAIPPSPSTMACRNIELSLKPGEVLGIAGESGCGKSTLITAIARLERMPAVISRGSIVLDSSTRGRVDIAGMDERRLRRFRWTDISLVMQSAMDSLNPVMRLGHQFEDVLKAHDPGMTRRRAWSIAAEKLRLVGITEDRLKAYPHELSGGMRQRASIALALSCEPKLVIMDEPTTAVDVVMQRQIVEQVMAMRDELGFAIIFVTHDLSLLMEFADRIAIMYAGEFVEVATSQQLYQEPFHPYAKGLRDSFPPLFSELGHLEGIGGTPASLIDPPPGCPFHPRCPKAFAPCDTVAPRLLGIDGRRVSCHLHDPAHRPEELAP